MDETERQLLRLLRDLEGGPGHEAEVTSTGGIIHVRRGGEEMLTGIPTANALDSLLARGWVAETGHGYFRITSAGLRAVGRDERRAAVGAAR